MRTQPEDESSMYGVTSIFRVFPEDGSSTSSRRNRKTENYTTKVFIIIFSGFFFRIIQCIKRKWVVAFVHIARVLIIQTQHVNHKIGSNGVI